MWTWDTEKENIPWANYFIWFYINCQGLDENDTSTNIQGDENEEQHLV